MASAKYSSYGGYTDRNGNALGLDIDKWFEQGVKSTGKPVQRGICSTTHTLYVLLFVVTFILLAAVIIVPIVLGKISKPTSG